MLLQNLQQDLSSAVKISPLEGTKRRGFIATRDIEAGETLAVDNALMYQILDDVHSVKLSKRVRGKHTLNEIDSILESLAPFYSNADLINATTRSKILDSDCEDDYSPPNGGTISQWTRRALLADSALCQNSFSIRLFNNSLFETPKCRALFCLILYANHSCNPNAEANQVNESLTSFDDEELTYKLTAKRRIKAGEEVTISYLPTTWPRSKRRGNLSATYDFDCDCEKCLEEEDKEEDKQEDKEEVDDDEEEEEEDVTTNEINNEETNLFLVDDSIEEMRWKLKQTSASLSSLQSQENGSETLLSSLPLFEVCVDSVESALAAQQAGADRIELCEALIIGGVTPSIGKIRCVLRKLEEDPSATSNPRGQPITVNVLIRPRGGDFCYSKAEVEMMVLDIACIKSIGRCDDRAINPLSVTGVVIGALSEDGDIDEDITAMLINAARPEMTVTFHRAIDAARDTMEAFKVCQRLRVDRVLTSGRAATAQLGVELIRQMVEESKKGEEPNVIVLAGGGVNGANATNIISATGVTELHGCEYMTAQHT
jgi:copper homeostasis protein